MCSVHFVEAANHGVFIVLDVDLTGTRSYLRGLSLFDFDLNSAKSFLSTVFLFYRPAGCGLLQATRPGTRSCFLHWKQQ